MATTHVTQQKPDHHYRTETPNIIWDLGLKVYARDLYNYYKRVAGDDGYCCTSSATIQKVLGMSPNTVNKYRKILEQPFDLIGGKPLIIATERLTEDGDPDTVYVEIVDIWRENGDNERQKAKERAKKQNRGTSRGEGGVPQEMREGTARDAYKEEPSKKNQNTYVRKTLSRFNFTDSDLDMIVSRVVAGSRDPVLLAERVENWKGHALNDAGAFVTVLDRWDVWKDVNSTSCDSSPVSVSPEASPDLKAWVDKHSDMGIRLVCGMICIKKEGRIYEIEATGDNGELAEAIKNTLPGIDLEGFPK